MWDHRNISWKLFPYITLFFLCHSVPTTLANLVDRVETRHIHQILWWNVRGSCVDKYTLMQVIIKFPDTKPWCTRLTYYVISCISCFPFGKLFTMMALERETTQSLRRLSWTPWQRRYYLNALMCSVVIRSVGHLSISKTGYHRNLIAPTFCLHFGSAVRNLDETWYNPRL